MSSKKLIVGIIVITLLFVFFIRYAFSSIQSVELKMDTQRLEYVYESFEDEMAFLEEYKHYEFVQDFSLAKIQILLIDHLSKEAILWNDLRHKENRQVIYEDIPDNIKYSNSFFVKLNDKNTLIMNCDELLGDIRERIVVDTYKYIYLEQSKLNPIEVSFFPASDENVYERFVRNKMIEALEDAYEDNGSLEDSKLYFEKWQDEVGDQYKSVAEYDWYEGSIEYIRIKVKQELDNDFQLSDYIESKKNEYNFFNKEEEYKLIGMLMILNAEKYNKQLYQPSQLQNDIYKNLLSKTPYISREIDKNAFNEFSAAYSKYNNSMNSILQSYNVNDLEDAITLNEILAESYDYTYEIDENNYVYVNYKARLKNKKVIFKDYIIAKVTPYKIQYYNLK